VSIACPFTTLCPPRCRDDTDLVEVVIEHIDNLRRAGHPTGPEDYLVQNTHLDEAVAPVGGMRTKRVQ
jgi:hypothetical protein